MTPGRRMPRGLVPAGWVVFVVAALVHLACTSEILKRVPRPNEPPRPLPLFLRTYNDAVHRFGPGADFFALYHAGLQLERKADIYSWDPDGITPPFYGYRYLPVFAEVAGPFFRIFPPWDAYRVWIFLLEALVVVNLWLLRRLFGPVTGYPWLGALWLLYSPLILELYMGQFTFLVATLIMATGVLLEKNRREPAVATWTVSGGIKMFTLILLPLWWRCGLLLPALAGIGFLTLVNLPGLVHSPYWWTAFVSQNVGQAPFNAFHSGNFGLVYILRLLGWQGLELDPTLWFPYISRFQVLVVGVAGLIVIFARRLRPLAGISILLMAHILSYFHVWEHHYVMLLPLGTFLLYLNRTRPARLLAAALCLVLLALPTPFILWDRSDPGTWDPTVQWSLARRLLLPGMKVVPTLVLFFMAARDCLEGGVAWPRWRVTPAPVSASASTRASAEPPAVTALPS